MLEVIIRSIKEDWFNPNAVYTPSVNTREKIDKARITIANFINCAPEEIIFTSSGSEANSIIINGLESNYLICKDAISHSSIMNSKNKFIDINVNRDGHLYLNDLETNFQKYLMFNNPLITIVGASNEIGTIRDIKRVSDLAHRYGGILHVDAVQLFPETHIDVQELGIDAMSVSGHKFGTPSGIGFLYLKKELQKYIHPILTGNQEFGIRGGTENTPFILGLEKAVQLLDFDKHKVIKIRDFMIDELLQISHTYLVGAKKHRLSNNINICFKGIDSSSLIQYLDLFDIYVSGGSACNSHEYKPSHVLQAIGLESEDLHSCVRFTINEHTTLKDVSHVKEIIQQFINRRRGELAE